MPKNIIPFGAIFFLIKRVLLLVMRIGTEFYHSVILFHYFIHCKISEKRSMYEFQFSKMARTTLNDAKAAYKKYVSRFVTYLFCYFVTRQRTELGGAQKCNRTKKKYTKTNRREFLVLQFKNSQDRRYLYFLEREFARFFLS